MKNVQNWLKEKISLGHKKTAVAQSKSHHPAHPDGSKDFLRVIFLGGLDHVGQNMTAFETQQDIVIVDCGLEFPGEEMPGVDYIIPDVNYLVERKAKIRGIVITHGHLDHIGGLRHILPKIGNPPVYGSRISIGLIEKQLEEFSMTQGAHLRSVEAHEQLKLGAFQVEFAKVTHNIPGSFAVFLKTRWGNIVHTGDFKFDFTAPPPNDIPEFEKFARIGKEGVLLLLSDSTNATQPGYAMPETDIATTLEKIVQNTRGRLIIASFASNLARLQHIINSAVKAERKIFLSGRSMINNLAIAKKLNYVNFPEKAISKVNKNVSDIPDDKLLILTTGSQGEEFSALTRMANDQHAQVQIKPEDTIVLSSKPIPGTGNERAILTNINKFLKKGAKIITNEDLDVHTSGHAKQAELQLMLELTRPKYFIPVHGELFMRMAHQDLGVETGVPTQHVFLLQNGSVIDFKPNQAPQVHDKPLPLNNVYVDGLGGTEKEGAKVMEERKTMSNEGIVIVLYKISSKDRRMLAAPKVISKGFIYLEELEKINRSVIEEAKAIYLKALPNNKAAKQRDLRYEIQDKLSRFILKKIDREPLIVPIIIEM